MWGLRAIRVGVLLGGLLAAVASAGCCECCKNLCGGDKSVPATTSGFESRPIEANNGATGERLTPQTPGGESLTPERVYGGIY